jgi:inner membrane protein
METGATSGVMQTSKLLFKALIIGGMAIVLLIPSMFVQNIVKEREARQKEAVTEVSSKWAGAQVVTGPILVVPYEQRKIHFDLTVSATRHLAYFLPDKLDIRSKVNPEKKHRGIYEVMLYSSDITISGKFSPLPLSKMQLTNDSILWNEAALYMGISDPKGLKSEIQLTWNGSPVNLGPTLTNETGLYDAFSAPVMLTGTAAAADISFSGSIRINGSEQLLFTPVGKETKVQVESAWTDPSFKGSLLPDTTSVGKTGFTAEWKSFSHTRRFPQQWKDNAYTMSNTVPVLAPPREREPYSDVASTVPVNDNAQEKISTINLEAFGVSLFVPVTSYQKINRSVKYAILCILLTFAAFFIIETINKKSVHPFQYGLIGMALILFYTLLLSFSEYTGFNVAYVIATAATVGLIGWFVKGILQSTRLTTVLSLVLVLLYSYIFTILQLQDYSLILGSVGLFLTLAVIMHFSRKIKW